MQSITNNNIITSTVGYKTGTHGYSYYGNGNMAIDSAKQISISYNMLDLPQSLFTTIIGIQDPSRGHGHGGGGPVIVPLAPETYSYDADGNKLAFAYQSTATDHPKIYTYYIDGIQYDTDPNTGGLNLSFIQTEEGRVLPYSTDTANYYQYYLTDHLGNTRVAFDSPTGQGLTVEQLDDYLPFGLDVESIANYPANEYLYNKKELQQFTGLYDYGARFYDPVTARFTAVDPLAEKSRRFSTYTYVEDNPIRNIDPDGMEVEDADEDCCGIHFITALPGTGLNKAIDWLMQKVGFPSEAQTNKVIFGNATSKDKSEFTGKMIEGSVTVLSLGTEGESGEGNGFHGEGPKINFEEPKIDAAYKRPNNATTPEQRAAVQNKPCVKCGATDEKMIAGHKKALVEEHYETGKINKKNMRDVNSVQSECATCSAKEGAEKSKYSKEKKKLHGF